MKAILLASRFEGHSISIDVEYREDDDTVILTKTFTFASQGQGLTVRKVKDAVRTEARRIETMQRLEEVTAAAIGRDLLA